MIKLSKADDLILVAMRLGETPVPIPNTWLRPGRPMVLHWRRCGRVGGRQIKKEKKAEPLPKRKFIIDTGKDEQQLIAANPISRAVLL